MPQYHLVILVHGLWGNSSHMAYLAQSLQNAKISDSQEILVVHRTESHSGYLTYDGIGVNGKRVADEITTEKLKLEKDGKVVKFSIIGYSMGGLIARYALGILKHDGFFDEVEPVNFVTFCTPHVGAINPSKSLSSRMFNIVAPCILSHTGSEMFLRDKPVVKAKKSLSLLEWMANPASKFYKALESFENRTAYANIINDKRTSWYTTAIDDRDPFNSMINESSEAYSLNYIRGYEPTVIDVTKHFSFNAIEEPNTSKIDLRSIIFKAFSWCKVLGHLVLVMPIYSLLLFGNYMWQRIQLSQRLKQFAKESSESLNVLYEWINDEIDGGMAKLETSKSTMSGYDSSHEVSGNYLSQFEETVRGETDLLVESIYGAMNNADYHEYNSRVIPPAAIAQGDCPEASPLLSDSTAKETEDNFQLNLTPAQKNIVRHLNALEWKKFPVIIRKTKASHAAVIYRHPDPNFAEGETVVRHFLNEVFRG
ncbi:hypothetical protein FOB63_000051 [Clavispora lusitaniae]|uniref:uncharacterized protein n=1 Tax=Clavispora lusitaniae TaxID=36911 RepID=UPI00202C0162|nr:hypothetical protein FOB63_000051 [Clavispora lusitaniae]